MRAHQLRWRIRRLSPAQQVLAAVAVFLIVVFGGLYGPEVIASGRAKLTVAAATNPAPTPHRYYRNCAAAHAAGVYSIRRGAPGYRPALDADDDGVACEPYVGG
jgi:hypothetical protein